MIYLDGSGGQALWGVSGDYFKGGTSLANRKRRRSSQTLQLTKAKVAMVSKVATFITAMPGTVAMPGAFDYVSPDGLLHLRNQNGTSGTLISYYSPGYTGDVYGIPMSAVELELVSLTSFHSQSAITL